MKGTIKPRGKSYQVRLPYKNKSGIWTARTGTAKTKEAAEAMLRQFISEETKGIDMSNPSFAEVANEWYNEKKLSASYNTLEVYRYAKNKLIVEFGTTKIKDIKRKNVAEYYYMLKQAGIEPKFIRGVLHSIMLYAISAKYIMDNPVRDVKITRTNIKAEHKILNLEDRQAIIEAFNETRYYYPIIIGLKTGMRLGELMGLKWSNVNFKEGYIDVNQQLTRNGMSNKLKSRASYRRIYLDKETKDILLEMKGTEYTNEEFVFTERTTVFRCMFKALEPHEISPHDLRHNHATDLLGVMNPADAAKRMGHTVAEYIRTYVHSSDDIQKQAVKNLPVLKSESNLNKSRNISRGKVIKLATRAT